MNKSIVLRVFCAAVVLAALASAPESVLAQRGGGFHGGGGGGGHYGGYHGGGYYGGHGGYYGGYHRGGYYGGHGGYYGGYHGAGYYGWHGGYYGWRGGYWGYPGYGYGWGFGLNFSFGPYWGYGYAPVWAPPYDPYYYPYTYYYPGVPVSYPSGYSVTIYRTGGDVRASSPAEPSIPVTKTPTLRGTPNANSPAINYAAYRPTAPVRQRDAATTHPSNYRSPQTAAQPLRPEVQNVIQALRGMPPDTRQREIDSGRYSNLSPQELKLVRYAANLPPVKGNPAVGAPLQTN